MTRKPDLVAVLCWSNRFLVQIRLDPLAAAEDPHKDAGRKRGPQQSLGFQRGPANAEAVSYRSH